MPPDVPQRGLALAVLAGRHDRPGAHVRAQREEGKQQAALEDITFDALVGGHRGELPGETGQGLHQRTQLRTDGPGV